MKLVTIPEHYELSLTDIRDITEQAFTEAEKKQKNYSFYDALFCAICEAYKYGFTRGHNFAKNKHRKACKS